MDSQDLDDVVERADRGRVFYEMFPGTAAADEWIEERRKLESTSGSGRTTERVRVEETPASRTGHE